MHNTLRNLGIIAMSLSLSLPIMGKQTDKHPNVLLIVTDDQGYGDLSLHDNPYLETPAMDALAANGVRLDNFYVSPVCAPTRASLLTGRYHPEVGVTSVTRRREVMDPEETTLAELFQANGYATGCFGKWHNGSFYPETPSGQGFEEFYGFPYGHIPHYFDPELEHNGEAIHPSGYITDLLTDAAIGFIDKEVTAERPFFCYLAYNAPHTPALVSDDYFDRFKAMGLSDKEAAIYGMLASLDDNMQRLFDHMRDLGIWEDTIIIFMSDNGPIRGRYNAGLKGWKAHYDEGGVRVPFFIRWGDHFANGDIVKERLAHIDVLPTLVKLCGLKGSSDLSLDGQDFSSLLYDTEAFWPDRILYTLPEGNREHIENFGSVRDREWLAVKQNGQWSLYHLSQDPTQQVNLAENRPDILARMRDAYEQKYASMPYRFESTPIPVGYAGHSLVRVEAHDATLYPSKYEGIHYNFPAGFAHHWITNWTDKDAYPEWTLNVRMAGQYEVTLFYCLAPENVGVSGEVELEDQRLPFTLNEAFDPPVVPQPFRLDGEAEKYAVKPWKPVSLGNVSLSAGPAILRVHLTSIPGEEGMELKAIELRKQ